MKFLVSCYTDINGISLRNYLNNLGYELCPRVENGDLTCYLIANEFGRSGYISSSPKSIEVLDNRSVDCRGRYDMFKALVALNDTNDKNQWFISTGGYNEGCWINCPMDSIEDYIKFSSDANIAFNTFRKATVDEIVVKFNERPKASNVILFADNKLLLLRRNTNLSRYPGMLCTPGGKRERTSGFSTIEDGAVTAYRELAEETGINLSKSKFEKYCELDIEFFTVDYYVVRLSYIPEVKLSSEHTEYLWVSEDEFKKYSDQVTFSKLLEIKGLPWQK